MSQKACSPLTCFHSILPKVSSPRINGKRVEQSRQRTASSSGLNLKTSSFSSLCSVASYFSALFLDCDMVGFLKCCGDSWELRKSCRHESRPLVLPNHPSRTPIFLDIAAIEYGNEIKRLDFKMASNTAYAILTLSPARTCADINVKIAACSGMPVRYGWPLD
jgi:hypothetical protein